MFDHDKLSALMDFDHVIYVSEDGSHAESAQNDLYAPTVELQDGKAVVHGKDWQIITQGLTGQYGGGDTLHSSELIVGAVADRILEDGGGYYAAVVEEYYCDENDPECFDPYTYADVDTPAQARALRVSNGCDCDPAGWTVVKFTGTL